MIVVLVHVTPRKNLKAVRGSYLPFIIKRALFPLGTTSLIVSCSGLWGVCVQTFVTQCQIFYHIILVAWHYINQGFMCFYFFFIFCNLMPWHSMLNCVIAVRPICLKIPSNLLHMELNRTHVHEIWVLKPLWLAVACTCSSNFNYGH